MKKTILIILVVIMVIGTISLSVIFWRITMFWDSMYPTFEGWNILTYSKWFNIDRWDIIIYKTNKDSDLRIWRIIWVWGDSIEIKNGKVFIKKKWKEGFVGLDEIYLSEKNKLATFLPSEEKSLVYDVPEGSVFILGDNRPYSLDSRSCFSKCEEENSSYYLKEDLVIWKVLGK